jgi:hypothetical protein
VTRASRGARAAAAQRGCRCRSGGGVRRHWFSKRSVGRRRQDQALQIAVSRSRGRVPASLAEREFGEVPAAITLAGIELAHRIRKGQYSLQGRHDERSSSLKELWDAALKPEEEAPSVCSDSSPPRHQISKARQPTQIDAEKALLGCRLSEGRDPWFLRAIPPVPTANGGSVIEGRRRCPYAAVRTRWRLRRACERSRAAAAHLA